VRTSVVRPFSCVNRRSKGRPGNGGILRKRVGIKEWTTGMDRAGITGFSVPVRNFIKPTGRVSSVSWPPRRINYT